MNANKNKNKNTNKIQNLSNQIASAIRKQNQYERAFINLIASDNAKPRRTFSGPYFLEGEMVQEGKVEKRPYAGAIYHNELEKAASALACTIFDAEHANLQPHSCSQANQAVYFGLLNNGDKILALDFKAGGHLTHGIKANFSGRNYEFNYYKPRPDGIIDYDELAHLAETLKPRLLICGSSAYPRNYDYKKLREITLRTNTYLMCDIAHEAGLISAGALENPMAFSDVVTVSLDKTMRGVSSAFILCKRSISDKIDRGVHPGTQSSFPIRRLAETAATLMATQSNDFREYAFQTLKNAKILEQVFLSRGFSLVTGGTDKHLLVLDMERTNRMKGAHAETLLENIGILTNRQMVPLDLSNRFQDAGGLRIGTAWATSRGYREEDFEKLGNIISSALLGDISNHTINAYKKQITALIDMQRQNDVWRTGS